MPEDSSTPDFMENVQANDNAEESDSSNFTNSVAFILGSIRSEVESEQQQLKTDESIAKSNGKLSKFSGERSRRDRPPMRRGQRESFDRIHPRQFYQQERRNFESEQKDHWRGNHSSWKNNHPKHENPRYRPPARGGNRYNNRRYYSSRPYRGAHRPRNQTPYDDCRESAPSFRDTNPSDYFRGPEHSENFRDHVPLDNFRNPVPPDNFKAPENFQGQEPPENFRGLPRGNFRGRRMPENPRSPVAAENFRGPAGPGHFRGPAGPENFRGPAGPENFRGPAGPGNFRGPAGPGNFRGSVGPGNFRGPAGPGNFRGSVGPENFRGQRSRGRHFRGRHHEGLNNRMHRPQGPGSFESHSSQSHDQTYDMSISTATESYDFSDPYLGNYGPVEDHSLNYSDSYSQVAPTETVPGAMQFSADGSSQYVGEPVQNANDYYYWSYDGMPPDQMVSYEVYPQGQPGDDPNYIYYYNTFYIDTDMSDVDPSTGQPITEETPVLPNLPAEEPQSIPPPPTEESLSKVELSTNELKSLADTVASLENTTLEKPNEENEIDTKPRPIGEVIESLLNRKEKDNKPAESDMDASFSTVKSEDKSALGMNLNLGSTCSTEGVLDRLESKFASSNEAEKTEDSSRISTMEANLAKAYSHFLQAAENRKRQTDAEKKEDDDDCAEVPPKVSRNILSDGLGISLDMGYDMDLMIKKSSPSELKNSPSPIKSSYQPIDTRTVGGSFERDQRTPAARRNFFEKSPSYRRVGSPSTPSRQINREPSPEMGVDFDDDRLSSSPEAPNIIEDDVDNSNFDAPDDTNFDMSPPSNSRGHSPPVGDFPRGRDGRGSHERDRSITPPRLNPMLNLHSSEKSESSLSWNQNSKGPNNWKPMRKFKYCNKFKSEDGCPAKFERQYPDYYEHYKAEHGLRNGVPCVEFKCNYIARGPENFLNHIKARHPETL